MASGPITSWQIDGETMQTVTFIFGGSKITADGGCSHEIKRCLLLGMNVITVLLRVPTTFRGISLNSGEVLKAQHSENEDHGIWSLHFMGNRWGNSVRLYFWGAPKSLQMVIAVMKLKDAYSLEGKYDQPR